MQSKDKQIAQILSEFMEWYDEPKTNLLHKEGFNYQASSLNCDGTKEPQPFR